MRNTVIDYRALGSFIKNNRIYVRNMLTLLMNVPMSYNRTWTMNVNYTQLTTYSNLSKIQLASGNHGVVLHFLISSSFNSKNLKLERRFNIFLTYVYIFTQMLIF